MAAVGFVLALFLRQVPLRDPTAGGTDLGEGFGMPTDPSPETILETTVGRVLRRHHGVDLEAVAHSRRSRLDTAQLWALIQIYRHAAVRREASLFEIAAERRVPWQVLRPTFDRLIADGFATEAANLFALTPAGAAEINSARDIIASWITEMLSKSTDFHGYVDPMKVQGALDRIARNVLIGPDSGHDETRPMPAAAG